jgi:hypothetical protein
VISIELEGTTLIVMELSVGRPRTSVAIKLGLAEVAAACGFWPLGFFVASDPGLEVVGAGSWFLPLFFFVAVGWICCGVEVDSGWTVVGSLTIGVELDGMESVATGVLFACGVQALVMIVRIMVKLSRKCFMSFFRYVIGVTECFNHFDSQGIYSPGWASLNERGSKKRRKVFFAGQTIDFYSVFEAKAGWFCTKPKDPWVDISQENFGVHG